MWGCTELKKHKDRPALYGCQLWRWWTPRLVIKDGEEIEKVILVVDRMPWTPIQIVKQEKSVWQTWIRITPKRLLVRKKAALTYLGKGSFLCPLWQIVPKRELDYYQKNGFDLAAFGIAKFRGKYKRLTYMQVEDLDHIDRQQDHILDTLFAAAIDFYDNLPDICRAIEEEDELIKKISERKVGVVDYKVHLRLRIRSWHRSINSYIDQVLSPNKIPDKRKIDAITSVLKKMIDEIAKLSARPYGRRFSYARRSLIIAISHIQSGNYKLARARLKSALKNLEYPEEVN